MHMHIPRAHPMHKHTHAHMPMQIYLATMVMSTVGYGDKHPDTGATRALTVPLAYRAPPSTRPST